MGNEYARVSTREQNLSSQEDALDKVRSIRIFTDKISGKEFNREGLKACMDYLRSGDTLFIYRLDHLGRFVKEMLDLCAQLENRRIKLVSLQDNLDTSTAVGRFTMQILAVSHWRSITAILFLKVAKPVSKQLKSEVLSLGDRKV